MVRAVLCKEETIGVRFKGNSCDGDDFLYSFVIGVRLSGNSFDKNG